MYDDRNGVRDATVGCRHMNSFFRFSEKSRGRGLCTVVPGAVHRLCFIGVWHRVLCRL